MPTTPTTLPNLPNLAGTSVTPNVPAHVLSDTDITIVNSSTTPGIGADRKVTLGELKSSIVTPITNPIAETVSAITSKAILADLKDANSTTGILVVDVSGYSCDLLVKVDNSTSVEPPVSPGYFTLQIVGILPAGASLRVANSLGSLEGDELNVKVSFTKPYTYGIGATTLSGVSLLPLLSRALFAVYVGDDGQHWLGDSVDNVAVLAYRNGKTVVEDATSYSTKVSLIFNKSVSVASVTLDPGTWEVRAWANFAVESTVGNYWAFLRISSDSGTTPDDTQDADAIAQAYCSGSGYTVLLSAAIPGYKITVSSRQSYYLKITGGASYAVSQYAWGRVMARRIA